MSLVRFAVRQCAARALRDATLAEGRIFQSAIDPLDTRINETRAPLLIVSTDDHKRTGEGRELSGGTQALDLVIEATIAAKVTTSGQDGDGDTVEVTIVEADSGLDLTLDIIEHQIGRAFLAPGVWPELFRRFVPMIEQRMSRRGADTSGVRWAARQITFTVDALDDPVGGEDVTPGSVWGDFLAAMEADAGLAPVAPLIRAVIAGDARDWVTGCAMIGVGAEIGGGLGFAPVVTDDGGDAVLLEDAELGEGDRP